MKKQLLSLSACALLLTSGVTAQPTLTATGINPVVGDNLPMQLCNYVSPGSSGANQTWNLASLSSSSTQNSSIVSVGSTPNGASFSGSSNCSTDGSYYAYYTTSASAWQNSGIVAPSGVVITYSNKEDLLRFPFTYNNTYTDAFSATFVQSGYTYYRAGDVTVTADSYGTLILPNGTFSNVTRVHFHEVYQDSVDLGGFPYIIDYDNDEYMWYLNGNHSAIAAVYSFTTMGSTSTTALYRSSVVGINEASANSPLFSTFPTPAGNEVSIKSSGMQNTEQLEITDLSGKIHLNMDLNGSMKNDNTLTIDISPLNNGVYFITLRNREGISATRKLIIAK